MNLFLVIQGSVLWTKNINEYITVNSLWIGLILLLLLVIITLSLFFILKYARTMKSRWKQSLLIAQKLQPDNDLEQNMSDILEQVSNLVDAPTYVMYLFDESKQVFLMKAVRHRSHDFGKVEPSYSGLVEYKKEQYLPPLSLSMEQIPEEVKQQKVGEVILLQIPIGDRKGLVRVGPISSGRLNKRTKRNLQDFSEMMKYTLRNLMSIEQIRNKANVIVSTGEALQRINGIALDSNTTVDFVLRLAVQAMNAEGAFFGILNEGEYKLTAVSGTDPSLLEDFEKGKYSNELFFDQSDLEDIRLITQEDDAFYHIPPYVAAIGAEAFAVIDVSERREEKKSRMFVLWFNQAPNEEEWKEARETLTILADNMREVLGYQWTLTKFSGTYVHILKTLARIQDNLIPYTVGYSELMSRYSMVIAKEMGLDDDIIQDIALAAYLSNIGVIGISSNLVNKEGKYTDEEFGYMKLHSEIGASIVQSTLSNDRVSSYIMHHHERMDGNGYPMGISGDEIPVGSRIIGVVQTLLAVINGREYRDPLTFDKALQTLEASVGTQLDSKIVKIFIEWFKKKQSSPEINGRSLGACWEMCCTPSSICEHCPAYQQRDKNCWEFEENNCQAHGKTCETCYVRTETLARKENVNR